MVSEAGSIGDIEHKCSISPALFTTITLKCSLCSVFSAHLHMVTPSKVLTDFSSLLRYLLGTNSIPDTGRDGEDGKENSPGRCSWAGAYAKLFSRLCTHNPIDSSWPPQEVGPVVHTVNRWGSWGTEKLSHLHRITQLATRGLGLEPEQSGSRVCA